MTDVDDTFPELLFIYVSQQTCSLNHLPYVSVLAAASLLSLIYGLYGHICCLDMRKLDWCNINHVQTKGGQRSIFTQVLGLRMAATASIYYAPIHMSV